MNILVVFTFGYSLKTWSDSKTLDREIAIYKHLHQQKGINFTFLTYGSNFDNELINHDGLNVIPIYQFLNVTQSKYKMLFHSIIFPFRYKYMFKDVDIIKQHQISGIWLSVILKLLTKKPLYTRTGYDMHLFSKFENKNMFKRIFYYICNQIGLIFSDIFTVSNSFDFENTKKRYLFTKNIYKRTNWIIKQTYNPFEKRHNNIVVSVGRIEKQKNFFELIENFSNSNFEIHIFGNGSLEDELQKYAKEHQVKLTLFGSVPNDVLQKKLSNYKYFVSTSIYEGNPKSVMEALALGCLVLASDIPNHKDLITDNKNGLLFELGSRDLNKKFFNVADKNSKLTEISKNAYKESVKNYELSFIATKEFEDYILLLNQSR